jgi:hypothetical protein
MSAQDHLEKYKQNVCDTCKVFELLSLAVLDDKSPLESRPTSDLIDLVAPPREPQVGGKFWRQKVSLLLDCRSGPMMANGYQRSGCVS